MTIILSFADTASLSSVIICCTTVMIVYEADIYVCAHICICTYIHRATNHINYFILETCILINYVMQIMFIFMISFCTLDNTVKYCHIIN
jgi:hypothetical protein